MALDAITKWKIADAVFLSGRQHFSPSQKVVVFFSFSALCNFLDSPSRTERNVSYESRTKLQAGHIRSLVILDHS